MQQWHGRSERGNDDLDFPARSRLAQGLDERARGVLVGIATRRSIPAGVALPAACEHGGTVWLLEQGALRRCHVGLDGDERCRELLGPGAIVGVESLLSARSDRPPCTSVRAEGAIVAWSIESCVLRDLAAACAPLARNVHALVADELALASEHAWRLARCSIEQRIALVLLDLLGAFGDPADDAGVRWLGRRVSQCDLAELACASREKVNAVLRDLRELGAIAQRGRTMGVADLAALQLAGGHVFANAG